MIIANIAPIIPIPTTPNAKRQHDCKRTDHPIEVHGNATDHEEPSQPQSEEQSETPELPQLSIAPLKQK